MFWLSIWIWSFMQNELQQLWHIQRLFWKSLLQCCCLKKEIFVDVWNELKFMCGGYVMVTFLNSIMALACLRNLFLARYIYIQLKNILTPESTTATCKNHLWWSNLRIKLHIKKKLVMLKQKKYYLTKHPHFLRFFLVGFARPGGAPFYNLKVRANPTTPKKEIWWRKPIE